MSSAAENQRAVQEEGGWGEEERPAVNRSQGSCRAARGGSCATGLE